MAKVPVVLRLGSAASKSPRYYVNTSHGELVL